MQLPSSKRNIILNSLVNPFVIVVLTFLFATTSRAQDQTTITEKLPTSGREVMQRQAKKNLGYHDQISTGQMIIKGTSGAKSVHEFEFRLLEKDKTKGAKSLIKILRPADLKGTGLLSFQNKNREDDQWLYLPAIKRTKRIAGLGRSGRFIGSEFTYEDLMPRDIGKYEFFYLKIDSCGSQQCYIIESRPKFKNSGYSKTISWIRVDNYQNVKIHFYDKKGRLLKEASMEQYQLLNNKFWRPLKIVMKNLQNQRETRLIIRELRIQAGLSSTDFTRRVLER